MCNPDMGRLTAICHSTVSTSEMMSSLAVSPVAYVATNAALMQKYIGLYLLTDVCSHTLIVVL